MSLFLFFLLLDGAKISKYFVSMQLFVLKKNKKLVKTNKYSYICGCSVQGAHYCINNLNRKRHDLQSN